MNVRVMVNTTKSSQHWYWISVCGIWDEQFSRLDHGVISHQRLIICKEIKLQISINKKEHTIISLNWTPLTGISTNVIQTCLGWIKLSIISSCFWVKFRLTKLLLKFFMKVTKPTWWIMFHLALYICNRVHTYADIYFFSSGAKQCSNWGSTVHLTLGIQKKILNSTENLDLIVNSYFWLLRQGPNPQTVWMRLTQCTKTAAVKDFWFNFLYSIFLICPKYLGMCYIII